MKRAAFLAVVLLGSFSFAPAALAQTKPAAAPASTTTPAAPAKWVAPLKGTAEVEFIQERPTKVGDEIVSPMKVKNLSDGAIALLKIDEYWYNKKREQISACTARVRQPINPGQIVDVEVRCQYKPDIDQNQLMFSHANGAVRPKAVKKFAGDAGTKATTMAKRK